jgi:hypothetical protein
MTIDIAALRALLVRRDRHNESCALATAAVNALPTLLDEVERLREENETMRGLIMHTCDLQNTNYTNQREIWAIREVANRISEPVIYEAVDRKLATMPTLATMRPVYEAACTWRERWNDTPEVSAPAIALRVAVDAARKEPSK